MQNTQNPGPQKHEGVSIQLRQNAFKTLYLNITAEVFTRYLPNILCFHPNTN